jgi:uncharacterized protein
MLEMRPNCECCNKNLPPQADDALICSFECTFCWSCSETRLGGCCPNCGGKLVPRPPRADKHLYRSPASDRRVVNPACAGKTLA